MTDSSQADESAARLASVRTNWERAAGLVSFAGLLDTIERVDTDMGELKQALSDVRARGYRFGRDWESNLAGLQERWSRQRPEARRLLGSEQRVLRTAARDVETLLQRAVRDPGLLSTAEGRVRDFEGNIRQAEQRVRGTFDDTWTQAQTLQEEVARARAVLDALDTASFDLQPDEHGVAVCEATWVSDNQEPEGLLFLTDARLIFEQRQEIAKKKVLFITTEKELIQEMLWASPIGAVDELEAEDQKAFLRRKEMLTLRFSEQTREIPSDITLQLKGADNDSWRTLIRRAKTGQIDADRFGAEAPEERLAEEVSEELAETEGELPTACPNCSAPLPPIFKGMKQVVCDYCGTTVNI
jgi:hypothetical protein